MRVPQGVEFLLLAAIVAVFIAAVVGVTMLVVTVVRRMSRPRSSTSHAESDARDRMPGSGVGYWRSLDAALSQTRGHSRQAITLARKSARGQVVAVVTGDRKASVTDYVRGCVVVTDTLVVGSIAVFGLSLPRRAVVLDRLMPHPVTITKPDSDDVVAVDIAGLPTMWCTPGAAELLRSVLAGDSKDHPDVAVGPSAADVAASRWPWLFVGVAVVFALLVALGTVAGNRSAPSTASCSEAKAEAVRASETSGRAIRLLQVSDARVTSLRDSAGEYLACIGTGYFSNDRAVEIRFGYKIVEGESMLFYDSL